MLRRWAALIATGALLGCSEPSGRGAGPNAGPVPPGDPPAIDPPPIDPAPPVPLSVLWSGDSILRYDSIRTAFDANLPEFQTRHEVAAYAGSTIGTALLEVSNQTFAFLDGAWQPRERGTPFDAFGAFVFLFMRNDASLSEGAVAYSNAYEKVLENAGRSFPRVIAGSAPPYALRDRSGWDLGNDQAASGGYASALDELWAEWSSCAVDTFELFLGLTSNGLRSVADLMRDQVHPSDGAGATEMGMAFARAFDCGRLPVAGLPAIPGRVVTFLFGEPVVGTWALQAGRSSTSPESPLRRVAGLPGHFISATDLHSSVAFPPMTCGQIWVHYLLDQDGGSTFTVYLDRDTARQRAKAFTTATVGPYHLHTMSRLVASDVNPQPHLVTIALTAGAPAPTRLLGITCVGAP